MFGYVRPSDGHLTAEDKQRFQAAYCGLCRSLGRRYGLAARMILNYDLAFLAMLLSREPECPTAHCRCPAHPIRGCDALEPQPAFDTAADLSVILTWWQLTDVGVTIKFKVIAINNTANTVLFFCLHNFACPLFYFSCCHILRCLFIPGKFIRKCSASAGH